MESPAPEPYTPTPNFPNSACFLDPNTTSLTLSLASRYFFLKTGDYANYINSPLYQYNGSVVLMSALTSITAGTASASKALVLDSSSNITGINNITFSGTLSGAVVNSNQYLLAGSPLSFSYISGITPGTASASKALVLDGSSGIAGIATLGLSSTSGGDMLTLTTTATGARNTIKFITDTQNWEIGSRGSTATNANNFYIYNSAYRLLMNPTGDTSILSSTDSSSSTTGALKISGGIGIVKNCHIDGILNLNRNGSQMIINNNAKNALLEVPSTPDILRMVRGHSINIGSNGVCIENSSTRDPRYTLDLGATAGNIKIALFDGGGGTYGIGANSSKLILVTGGNSGFSFWKSTTSGSLNTLQAEIDGDSNFIAGNNIFAGTGIVARQGFSSSGRSGVNCVMHQANTTYAEIFSYNYTTAAFKDILIGDTLLIQGGVKNVGIGIANPSSDIIAYPFVVNKTISSSISGSYGYLSNSGSGSGTGTGSVPVSIYTSGRIFATEFDAYSDRRLKHKIEKINAEQADAFIDKVEPVQFEWKSDDAGTRTGYIAQQLLSTGLFEDLVTYHVDDKMKSDDSGSPEGYSLTIQYQNIIAILHQALKNQRELIEDLLLKEQSRALLCSQNQKKINELELKLNELIYS